MVREALLSLFAIDPRGAACALDRMEEAGREDIKEQQDAGWTEIFEQHDAGWNEISQRHSLQLCMMAIMQDRQRARAQTNVEDSPPAKRPRVDQVQPQFQPQPEPELPLPAPRQLTTVDRWHRAVLEFTQVPRPKIPLSPVLDIAEHPGELALDSNRKEREQYHDRLKAHKESTRASRDARKVHKKALKQKLKEYEEEKAKRRKLVRQADGLGVNEYDRLNDIVQRIADIAEENGGKLPRPPTKELQGLQKERRTLDARHRLAVGLTATQRARLLEIEEQIADIVDENGGDMPEPPTKELQALLREKARLEELWMENCLSPADKARLGEIRVHIKTIVAENGGVMPTPPTVELFHLQQEKADIEERWRQQPAYCDNVEKRIAMMHRKLRPAKTGRSARSAPVDDDIASECVIPFPSSWG